jgi:hypothetical protein
MDRDVIIAGLVDGIRRATEDELIQSTSIFLKDPLLAEYIESLDHEDKLEAIRACVIVWVLTEGRVIPRVFQLKASLATLHQRDSVIIAGTGSGKTLCLLIPLLLCPDSISLTISPLKRLQLTQVSNTNHMIDILLHRTRCWNLSAMGSRRSQSMRTHLMMKHFGK